MYLLNTTYIKLRCEVTRDKMLHRGTVHLLLHTVYSTSLSWGTTIMIDSHMRSTTFLLFDSHMNTVLSTDECAHMQKVPPHQERVAPPTP